MSNKLPPQLNELIERFQTEWDIMVGSETLEQLEDTVTNVESSREEILGWIFTEVTDEEGQGEYFALFGQVETDLEEESGGIPIFDPEFDIYDSFDAYEGYYQRYGCMTADYVISWDKENVLFSDDDGVIEMIKRPDVLMGNQD